MELECQHLTWAWGPGGPASTGDLLDSEVVEGFVFFLSRFFSCRHDRVRLGHRELTCFLRAVADSFGSI